MDGTMVNNMAYHAQAWQQILHELGKDWRLEEVHQEMYGKNEEMLHRIFGGTLTEEHLALYSLKKEHLYQQIYQPHLRLIDGLQEVLEALSSAPSFRLAIGTSAGRVNVDFVLDTLGIRHFFDAIITAEDVILGKPDPETFLKAAIAIDVEPDQCLVFEDVPKGAEASFRAGMRTIMLTTTHTRAEVDSLPGVVVTHDNYHTLATAAQNTSLHDQLRLFLRHENT